MQYTDPRPTIHKGDYDVIVVGGGLVGCELALDLEQQGKKVTIVEGLENILNSEVPYPNKMYLKDSFELYGTEILTGAMLKKVTDTGAVIEVGGEEKELTADTVIISVGFKSLPSMTEELKSMGINVCEIGDGQKVGNVLTSIWSAFDAAKEI